MQSRRNFVFGPTRATALLFCTLSLSIAGCKTIPVEEFSANANPAAELAKTQDGITDAKNRQVDVLAPDAFAKAEKRAKKAQDRLNKNSDKEKILSEVAEANAYLARANNSAARTAAAMPEVLKARSDALAAKAESFDKSTVRKLDADLVDVTEDLEDSSSPSVKLKERDDLKSRYMAVELASIKDANLSSAQKTLAQAKREGAEKAAPESYIAAQNSLREAEAFIEGSRHDQAGVAAKSAASKEAADVALAVTREAKVIGGENAEMAVLERRRLQGKLAVAQAQTEAAKKELSTTTAGAEARTKSLEASNEALARAKAFNDRFESTVTSFTPQEAEVYREGNSLVMRLKKLSFASGKSYINASDYALLNRVRDAANSFAPATVVIEGHTDSVGNKAANESLALARAEAVKTYLTTNGLVSEGMKVEARGFGDQRPLAPNNTAAGRATNRRVDVIVTPDDAAMSH